MRVFFDTNIILEYLLDRKNANDVEKVLSCLSHTDNSKYISSGSFYTLTYLLEVEFKRSGLDAVIRMTKLRHVLNILLAEYIVIGNLNWKEGVNDSRFFDLEDSYQYQAALSMRCDVLLTFNSKDFKNALSSALSILTPAEFLLKYCAK